ncbi:MAG: PHP domain-containing protein [Armatimonadetes bacterium]|nr:PHP domain-containing protein [Armatimonadota bacterium]
MPGIDLHAHTTASDGTLTPTELVQRAHETGLDALAVTDHDTLAGLEEARQAGESFGVEVIDGIELAVEHAGRFHLLGYGFDPQNAALNDRLVYIQEYRANRNRKMVEKMREYGLDITWEEVEAEAGGDLIARPHMALALKRKGIVQTPQEAFDRFLQDGGPVHVPKIKMTDEEAIGLLRGAGGIPILAHPLTLKMGIGEELEAEVMRLKGLGLGGLEVYYPQHGAEETARLSEIADRLGLVRTGGSDFHGDPKPMIRLGGVIEGQPLPNEVLENLKAALRR